MRWQNYLYRPTSLLFQKKAQPKKEDWLWLVNQLELIRYPIDDYSRTLESNQTSPEELLGAFFCPNRICPWEILQVAGLLIKRRKLDVKKCLFSSKRFGGEIYFKWFLFILGELQENNPVPNVEFPLNANRWKKARVFPETRNA